ELANAVANLLAERMGTGQLIGAPEPNLRGPVEFSSLARPWREGEPYEAGAVVTHSGGLWQARNRTASRPPGRIGEWLLLADGIRAIHAYQEGSDPRAFGIVISLASGGQIDLPVQLPLPLHRGPYRPDGYYTIGDEVELDGATWRAMRTGPVGGPSADSGDWR